MPLTCAVFIAVIVFLNAVFLLIKIQQIKK